MTWLRDSGEGTRVRKKDIIEAVDKSLKRLGTDYIDLLQVRDFVISACLCFVMNALRRVCLR